MSKHDSTIAPSPLDAALAQTIERLAREQGKPIPTLKRARDGGIYMSAIFRAADALGVNASDMVCSAEVVAVAK